MKVSFLIVTYNSRDDLPRLIGSLVRIAAPDDEILFWDNVSTDDTLPFLLALRDPRIRVIESAENLGFGRGINHLARQARGDALVFVNPDCHWEDGDFQGWLRRNWVPMLGALAPLIRYDDGRIQPNQGGDSSLLTFILQFLRIGAAIRALGLPRLLAVVFRVLPQPASVSGFLRNFRGEPRAGFPDWVSGAFFATPRERFLTAGGFDDAYFMYSEDEDLCRRYRHAGLEIRFDPSFVVRHIVAGSQGGRGFSKARYERYRSQYLFIRKWYGARPAAGLKLFWAVAFPLKAALSALTLHITDARAELRYWRKLLLN